MGWKLTGLAIDKDFSKDFKSLMNLLGIDNFQFDRNSTFEEETFEILEDSALSVGFFENGTFLSTGIDLMTNNKILSKASIDQRIIAFYVNETSSTYCFDLYTNGKYVRSKWLSLSDEGIDSSDNFGDLLQEEAEQDDFEIIVNIISSIIGKNFYEIEEEFPMLRYNILPTIKVEADNQVPEKSIWKRLFG